MTAPPRPPRLVEAESPPPISVVLDRLLTHEERITVGELFDRAEERGFGLLMIALGLPMLIPVLPPGASTVVGALYALLAIQLFLGRERPWLPGRVRRHVLSAQTMAALRQRAIPLVRRMERFSRRRYSILNHPLVVRLAAVVVFLLGLLLASPAPFMNLLPTLAIMAIGFGLLNDDGVFVLAGIVAGGAVIGAFATALGLFVEAARRLFPWFFGP
ncbi:MAG: exopolysaccharide biosynthesis protein [Armatimonadota bacterium]|nr:exopolysaccharide biosynthesis protein [Armatimonadota bacterium]MDR7449182.1 exopolysaccharide biosynthesis protein [Armatimonadota bacterium]MDR7459062.1 exopolysaccharide biosynthesis protein [Armatimonadota bacterium]MDR7479378.1 exopolysaccharide biosynthesis protein [Armatimonadota bacterium]MDR7487420.1 exopolysaccharide biosynthesis protein [Armatimonadota bacterium]